MVPIRRNYDYEWNRGDDIAELTMALALRMKSSESRIKKEGIDSDRISLVLLRIYRDWWKFHRGDLDLQALLAVAASCEWLWQGDRERLEDLLKMLDEVSEAHYSNSRNSGKEICRNEFTTAGLRLAVARTLGADVRNVVLGQDLIEVEFLNGNYGDGLFDGFLCLDYLLNKGSGLMYIVNTTKEERQYFQGPDLPWTDVEVEEALASDLWKRNFSKRVFHTSEIRKARQSSHEQMQQHLLDASADIGSSNPSDLFSSRMDSIEAQRPDYDGSGPNLFGGHNSHNRSGFKPRYDAPLMSHVDVDYRNDLEPFKYPRRGESLMECTGDRGGDLGERFSGLEPTTYQDQVLRHIDNNVPQRQVPTKGEPSINERSTDLPAHHRNFIRDISEWRFQVPLG